MKSSNELRTLLRSIDHKGYPAYKSLAGAWKFPEYTLVIDHVQGDPFASPSALHIELPLVKAGFPAAYYEKKCMRIALQDFLTRQFAKSFEQYNFKAKGSGKSGLLSITNCGQRVLERSACRITDKDLIVRFHVGFPAFGRSINAGELEKILFDFLVRCVQESLLFQNLRKNAVEEAVYLAEDQEELRRLMRENNIVSFVANGSILPRKSGVSELPMKDSIAFSAPKSMEQSFLLPHHGRITGMAIMQGITLIVGGGFHGKSTLLEAIQNGVYNHIKNDGREFVLTEDSAVKLRAEDGRSIKNTDISMFIGELPNKKDTKKFSTEDASGSTSQAAGVAESIEAGAKLFLIDEDTSATNFMVRDELMQQVICRDMEPITPYIERVRDLYDRCGISTIMVAGSSGAFFYVADRILQMDCYVPQDITEQVRNVCQSHPLSGSTPPSFNPPSAPRVFSYKPGKANPRHEHMKVKSLGTESVSLEKENIDLRGIEQLIDHEQTAALGYLMRYALEQLADGKRTVTQIAALIYERLEKEGLESFCGSYAFCGLAKPRIQEFFACLNRFRG